MSGDPVALRLCLERIPPRREGRLLELPFPNVKTTTEIGLGHGDPCNGSWDADA